MLEKMIAVLLITVIIMVTLILLLQYLQFLRILEDKVILASWRPNTINGYYQCPNGYIVGPLNRSGYYPCGPCLIIINSSVHASCPG
ncbi:hypothetical protein [Caldivirga sp.]|jgi:hypothetical protein|uniref:hypothetical protein n=1 Tax=Caldivirga sp. TaxID=2080243 RepID=UPI003D110613